MKIKTESHWSSRFNRTAITGNRPQVPTGNGRWAAGETSLREPPPQDQMSGRRLREAPGPMTREVGSFVRRALLL